MVAPAERRVLTHRGEHGSVRHRQYAALGFASSQRLSQLLSILAVNDRLKFPTKRYVQGGNRDPYYLTPAAQNAGMSEM